MTNLGRYYQDTNYGVRVEVRTMPAGEVALTHGAEGGKHASKTGHTDTGRKT